LIGWLTATIFDAIGFFQAFFGCAAEGQGFADAFHLRGERERWPCASALREFLEDNARNLRDDGINARLEGRGVLALICFGQFVPIRYLQPP
jgi:hypothetical protein